MGTRARRFFARFNRLEFSAPLVEASSGYPELLGQLIDAFTALHPLYGHALKLPGISLSSLHECFLSRRVCPSRVCQFKGSFQLSYRRPELKPGNGSGTSVRLENRCCKCLYAKIKAPILLRGRP